MPRLPEPGSLVLPPHLNRALSASIWDLELKMTVSCSCLANWPSCQLPLMPALFLSTLGSLGLSLSRRYRRPKIWT